MVMCLLYVLCIQPLCKVVNTLSDLSGCPQFSKLSVLDDESYTKDDVIYLKCIVDTSRIFHP